MRAWSASSSTSAQPRILRGSDGEAAGGLGVGEQAQRLGRADHDVGLELVERPADLRDRLHQVEEAEGDAPALAGGLVERVVGAQQQRDAMAAEDRARQALGKRDADIEAALLGRDREQAAIAGGAARQADRDAAQHRLEVAAALGGEGEVHDLGALQALGVHAVEVGDHHRLVDQRIVGKRPADIGRIERRLREHTLGEQLEPLLLPSRERGGGAEAWTVACPRVVPEDRGRVDHAATLLQCAGRMVRCGSAWCR